LKNFFLADFAKESELNTLNFVIVTSFNNRSKELQNENQTDETLMNKGFQRSAKKNKK